MKSLFFGVTVVLLTAVYLWLLHSFSPRILERDRLSSVWYLRELADEKIREANELKWIAPREERQELLDEATRILEKIRVIRPDSEFYEYYWAVTKYRAVMFRTHPDPEEAATALDRILRMWEEGNRESERLGNLLVYHYTYLSPDPEKAEEILYRLLELNPKESPRYDELIDLLIAQGKTDKAIRYLEKKIDLQLATSDNRNTLATLYFQLGRWGRVEELLRSNLVGGATSLRSWLMYGVVLAIRGDLPSSLSAFRSYMEGADEEVPFPATPLENLDGYPADAFPLFSYLVLESSLNSEGAR